MAKFYGKIGYVHTQETSPDVWTEVPIERDYYGDVIKNAYRWEKGDSQNSDLNVSNRISIIADSYAYDNFPALRYVNWKGANWQVINVLEERPRLILTLGGVYNGRKGPTQPNI